MTTLTIDDTIADLKEYLRLKDAPQTGLLCEAVRHLEEARARLVPEGWVAVPREPTENMLRAGLDERYQRSPRSRKVKKMFPGGYEAWMKAGLKADAPDMAGEYRAMLAAATTKEGG